MAGRRKHLHRRKSWSYGTDLIALRVGSRRSPRKFHEVQVSGPGDAPRFARLVQDQVRAFPKDPLIIAVNGYQPWLEDIFASCIRDYWFDISDLGREVQFANTMQFPERASERGKRVPWTFILDHMNVPQVYYWSVNMDDPLPYDDFGLPKMQDFRFRIGVWQIGRGGCLFDRDVSVSIIFTQPSPVSDHVVTELMFGFLYENKDLDQPREDEEGICWLFLRLYWLLSDWQNIIHEIILRLNEAEANSHGRNLPVKLRARIMHNEIDRIYELKAYLNFHSRSLKKLQKLKGEVPQSEQKDPLWSDIDDAVDDLDHYDQLTDSLKERFNNLLDLEFNIQNAVQADNSQFLSVVATLFLPISYVASVFGITTVTWPAIWYLWVAIPVLIVSAAFTQIFPWSVRQIQKARFPIDAVRVRLRAKDFTMLGDQLPNSADAPGSANLGGKVRRRSQRRAGMDDQTKLRARSRSRALSEKDL